ncbi:uncharacterized protein LOC141850603 [Brevipalpus obovatus]|uniref:uncharacterized protein LOC141850603 n=1 Tax=Brevipalpus obovatus TaxID=246614 RepID=UPI003D9EC252
MRIFANFSSSPSSLHSKTFFCTILWFLSYCVINGYGDKGSSNIVVQGGGHSEGSVVVNSNKKSKNIIIRDHRGTVVVNDGKKGSNIVVKNDHPHHHKHVPMHHMEHPKMMPMLGSSRSDSSQSSASKYVPRSASSIKPHGYSEDEGSEYDDDSSKGPKKSGRSKFGDTSGDEAYPSSYGKDSGEDASYLDGPGPGQDRKGIRELEQGAEFGVEQQVEDSVEKQIEEGVIGPLADGAELGGYFDSVNDPFGTSPIEISGATYHFPSQPFLSESELSSLDSHSSNAKHTEPLAEASWTIPESLK